MHEAVSTIRECSRDFVELRDVVAGFVVFKDSRVWSQAKVSMIGSRVGSYVVTEQLGAGGMGAVFRAHHITLKRPAAIKVLLPQFSATPEIVQRFFNEAKAATEIRHLGIVEIYDFGQLPDGTAYIAMELLDGESLSARMRRHLGVVASLRIIRQMCGPLGAAHAIGIVHRDLKPDNVFIVPDAEVEGGERIKLLDFGIAKILDNSTDQYQTRTGAVMGTPIYMAPEQCRGVAVDHRADLYALGCMLYHLVAGRPPFVGEGLGDIMGGHMYQLPSPLQTTPRLDELLSSLLAKRPEDRPQSTREIAAAIDAILEDAQRAGTEPTIAPGSVTTLPSLIPGHQAPVAPIATTLSGAATDRQQPAARRNPVVAIGTTLVLGGAAVAALLFASTSKNKPQQEVPTAVPAAFLTSDAAAVAETPPGDAQDTRPDVARRRMQTVLRAFASWSELHPAASCPLASDLSMMLDDRSELADPWGQPFRITCSDQPPDQRIGVISAGPDGAHDTADDLRSWLMGEDTRVLVAGQRWGAATVDRPSAKPRPSVPKPKTKTSTPTNDGMLDPPFGGQP